MKTLIVTFVLFVGIVCTAQNNISKILVDKNTKEPLNGATINNSIDYTITNEDGRLIFRSEMDSVIIRMLGYTELKTTFRKLKELGDTIYLQQSPIALDEIILKDYKSLIFNTYANIPKNFPHYPFVDKFFLRCIIKRNDSLLKFEDVSGLIKRNSMFTSKEILKLKWGFQVLNQRKLGLLNKNRKVEDFELQSLEGLFKWFSTVFINPNTFNFTEEQIVGSNLIKIRFEPFKEYDNKNVGYYIVNTNDNSIVEYVSKTNPAFKDEISFQTKRGYKWRTINSELFIHYSKNKKEGKYYITHASLVQKIESFNRDNERTVFEAEYHLVVTEPFATLNSFKRNVKNSEQLFELNVDFDKSFWNNQNILPLTEELRAFKKDMENYEKEYKIESNF